MFNKHSFTCPDVVYLRNKQKKTAFATLGVYAIFFGVLAVAGTMSERRDSKKLKLVDPPIED